MYSFNVLCGFIPVTHFSHHRKRDKSNCDSRVLKWYAYHRPHSPPPSPSRIALQLQYDGTSFHGWERKPGISTVQSSVEKALSEIYGTSILVQAASRTDAGAHAMGQVIHYDAPFAMSSYATLCRSVNKQLPPSIMTNRVVPTVMSFDARKSAIGRTYRYTLSDKPISVFSRAFAWHVPSSASRLDVIAMNEAASVLWNEQKEIDMRAFRRARADATHTRIYVRNVSVRRHGDFIHVDVSADWFVYGMMRLLVASLVRVGQRRCSIGEFQRIVKEGDRACVVQGAPSNGLCLLRVEYDETEDPFRLTRTEGNNNVESEGDVEFVHPWYAGVS